MNRRGFLNRVVVTFGGAAVGTALPVSLLQASPACLAHDPCGDWTVDDMCLAYPPYAFRRDADQPRTRAMPEVREGLDFLFAG